MTTDTELPGTVVLDLNGTAWQYRGSHWGWYPAAPGLAPQLTLHALIREVGEVRVIATLADG